MLPYGIVYENNKDISTIPEKFDVFETQNYLYKELFSENEDMLEKVSTQKEKTEDDENK